jgi:hypothetical protein
MEVVIGRKAGLRSEREIKTFRISERQCNDAIFIKGWSMGALKF